MYNNTDHVLRYLLYYAEKNNKSLVLAHRSFQDLSWGFSFIEKGYEKTNKFILNESNIKQLSYSVSFEDAYSCVISLENLLPEKKVDFCLSLFKVLPQVFKTISQELITQISLEGILKNLWQNKSQQSNTIEFLNEINPLIFSRVTNKESTHFVKEIKENVLSDEFYRFLSNYFEKDSEIQKNDTFKNIFSELMRVAVTTKPDITVSIINKYPFLKEYFQEYQGNNLESEVVDFKRIKISLVKLNVALIDLGVANTNSILEKVLDEIEKNEKLKELGLVELIVKNQDVETKSIFLGFTPEAQISYLQVEDLITDCLLEYAKQKDKDSLPTVVNTLVLRLWLPEKNESLYKKTKI